MTDDMAQADDGGDVRKGLTRSAPAAAAPTQTVTSDTGGDLRTGMPRARSHVASDGFWSRVANPTSQVMGAPPPSLEETITSYNPDVGYVGQKPVPMTQDQAIAAQAGTAGLVRGLTPGSAPEFEKTYGSNPLAKLGQMTGTAIPLLLTEGAGTSIPALLGSGTGAVATSVLPGLRAGAPTVLRQADRFGFLPQMTSQTGQISTVPWWETLAARTATNAAQGAEGALFTGGDPMTGGAVGAGMGSVGWAGQRVANSPALGVGLTHFLDAHGVPRFLSHMVASPLAWLGNNLVLRPVSTGSNYLAGPAGAVEGYIPPM